MSPGRILAALLACLLLLGSCMGGVLLSLGGDEAPPAATLVAASGAGVCLPTTGPAPASVAGLDAEQVANSRVIIAEGKRRGIPSYGWVVAIAGARQESVLRNIDYGHASSVGLFQLIAAHGTIAQRMDPLFATRWFYGELEQVTGWQLLPVTQAAQRSLGSGHPTAYAAWEGLARQVVAALEGGAQVTGGTPCGVPVTGTECPAHERSPALENRLVTDAIRMSRCMWLAFGASPYIGSTGGFATSGHATNSDHYTGRAIDWGVREWQSGAGVPYGDSIAAWAVANREAFGITLIIWNKQSIDFRYGTPAWKPYRRGGNDPNLAHKNHVHISVSGNPAGAA